MEKVRERVLRSTKALASAGIPYAVAGGNAVAGWVSQVDETVVRQTRDVDILVRRSDLSAIIPAMAAADCHYAEVMGIHVFVDGPQGKRGDGVHLLFAEEKVRPDYPHASPDVTASIAGEQYRIVDLEPLVRMKLMSNRDKDRTHIRDLIEVGLVLTG